MLRGNAQRLDPVGHLCITEALQIVRGQRKQIGHIKFRWRSAKAGDIKPFDKLVHIAAQLDRATAVPKVPEWERIVTEMQVVAERMVRGQFSVNQAAREIDVRADRLLEKRRWMLDKGRTA